ncbi:MAG TPA: hypothetical protein DHV59_07795 [Oxalobacteraceae bacterium]|nr:hypothetical protein [Oxalobacteraceae bacterium]
MMTEDERKHAFWLLKKYSSYTLWKSFGDAFQAFTNAWEYAVKNAKPPLASDDLWVEALKNFWQACSEFDRGLFLLKQGDRQIFRKNGNRYIFLHSRYAEKLMDSEEYVHNWMVNEQEVKNLFEKFDHLGYGPGWITEQVKNCPAVFGTENIFRSSTYPFSISYSNFNFPDVLSDVPFPSTCTVDTGNEVPFDGIWEPEWPDADTKRTTAINIRSLFAHSSYSNVEKGCMNYLIAGTVAPLYQDGVNLPKIPVRWRLIWQDQRYKDGLIPVEESKYLSNTNTSHSTQPVSLSTQGIAGNQACPQTGYWFTPAQADSRRHFKEGDPMPEVKSNYGATIWQWDSDQA